MSDTTAAILILPTLAALVLVLECSRVGCTRVYRTMKRRRESNIAPKAAVLERG